MTTRRPRTLRRLWPLWLGLLLAACGGSQPAESDPDESDPPDVERTDAGPDAEPDGADTDDGEVQAGFDIFSDPFANDVGVDPALRELVDRADQADTSDVLLAALDTITTIQTAPTAGTDEESIQMQFVSLVQQAAQLRAAVDPLTQRRASIWTVCANHIAALSFESLARRLAEFPLPDDLDNPELMTAYRTTVSETAGVLLAEAIALWQQAVIDADVAGLVNLCSEAAVDSATHYRPYFD